MNADHYPMNRDIAMDEEGSFEQFCDDNHSSKNDDDVGFYFTISGSNDHSRSSE